MPGTLNVSVAARSASASHVTPKAGSSTVRAAGGCDAPPHGATSRAALGAADTHAAASKPTKRTRKHPLRPITAPSYHPAAPPRSTRRPSMPATRRHVDRDVSRRLLLAPSHQPGSRRLQSPPGRIAMSRSARYERRLGLPPHARTDDFQACGASVSAHARSACFAGALTPSARERQSRPLLPKPGEWYGPDAVVDRERVLA